MREQQENVSKDREERNNLVLPTAPINRKIYGMCQSFLWGVLLTDSIDNCLLKGVE